MTLLAYVVPPLGAIGLFVLAQTSGPSDPSGIVAPVANLSATAILIWYVWYNQTRTLPGITKDHKDAMLAVVSEFKSEVAAERSQCLEQHKESNGKHETTHRAVANLHQEVTLHRALVDQGLKRDGVINK